jgi:DNA-directed RNA polymerase subunit RPC12/RpoP
LLGSSFPIGRYLWRSEALLHQPAPGGSTTPKLGDLAITENLTVHVAGGCPNCGNPALLIPEEYNDDTVVTCPECDYKARWKDVFGDEKEI